MLKVWLNSPGHYANIVTADYDITGLSIHFNKKRNSFIAVQKFAIVTEFYLVNQNNTLFPYASELPQKITDNFVSKLPDIHKNHAFGIKENKKEEICSSSNSSVSPQQVLILIDAETHFLLA